VAGLSATVETAGSLMLADWSW